MARTKKEREEMQTQEKPAELLVTTITSVEEKEIRDRKMVTGTFTIEGKSKGLVRIGAMRKYKGDPLTPRTFEHGKQYTIPVWYANWLNGIPDEEMRTPACRKIIHLDQNNDLNNKRPLADPEFRNLFRFTPVTKW